MDKNLFFKKSISHHGYPKIKIVVNNIALRCFKKESKMRMVDNMHVLATIRHIRYPVVTRESGRKKSGIMKDCL